MQAPEGEAGAGPGGPRQGRAVDDGQQVAEGPEGLEDDAAAVGEVGEADGAAQDGVAGVLAEDGGGVGGELGRVRGVQDGEDGAGGVHDGA